ncbi:MAG: GNAT family N-acetyltransferase [Gemmatimonadales bacterium]
MPASSTLRIRLAASADTDVIAAHRAAMFRDMGRMTPAIEPEVLAASAAYLRDALHSGEYVGWFAVADGGAGQPVGGAGVFLRRLIPRPSLDGRTVLAGREGLIVNVYVEPAFRRQGIARLLMETILQWVPQTDVVRLTLHASADGKPLYQALGFIDSNEMVFPRGLRD